MADDSEAKHGGNKNGKKEATSGSSFFTWFMVIALLGVWTSVAVVWFELVDYEEVLAKAKDFRYNLSEVLQGKLGIYDADGDGDFDVEDAKVLLGEPPGGIVKRKVKGLKEKSVTEQPTVRDTEEVIQPVEEPHITAEHRSIREPEPDDEIDSFLHDIIDTQLGMNSNIINESKQESDQESDTEEEHAHEEGNFQEKEENNEISDVPVIEEEYNEELGDKIPEILERHGSLQEESISDYEVEEPDVDDTPVTYEYHTHVEEDVYQPEGTDDTEFNLEDALDHNTEKKSEDMEQQEYANERDLENEELIEAQDTDGEPIIEHYDENIQDTTDSDKDSSDYLTEHFEPDEKEYVEDHVAAEPHETEIPVMTEDYANDELVDT